MTDWKTTITGLLGGAALYAHDALAAGQAVTLRGVLSFLAISLIGLFAADKKKNGA